MADLAAFEARASEAERRLAALELKLINGGGGGMGGGAGGGSGDSDFKKKVLAQMLELRSSLGRARVETQALEKAHAEAMEKNVKLQDENDRLKYRVSHLVRHVKGDSA